MILLFCSGVTAQNIDLKKLKSPILFEGNDTTAYRDPAIFVSKRNKLFIPGLYPYKIDGSVKLKSERVKI